MVPAFLNVRVPQDGPIDVWPFLIEKAYANYYGSYEALGYGNMLDFVEEVTGSPSVAIRIKSDSTKKTDKMSQEQTEAALAKISKALRSSSIAVG
jgi:hypothetical protein